jgi:hypothetical protein
MFSQWAASQTLGNQRHIPHFVRWATDAVRLPASESDPFKVQFVQHLVDSLHVGRFSHASKVETFLLLFDLGQHALQFALKRLDEIQIR